MRELWRRFVERLLYSPNPPKHLKRRD